jgi:hypothetical protein
MRGINLRRFLIIITICLLLFPSIQIVLGENKDSSVPNKNKGGYNEHYTNCIILIFGTCNDVTGPLLWRFGLYLNLLKRDFTINAKGEFGETINLIIRGGGSFKFIWGQENIKIDLNGASGILFWGKKSIIIDSTHIILRCNVKNLYLSY